MRPVAPLLLLIAACSRTEPPGSDPGVPACDPTDPSICALPWPSATFQAADPDTWTGVRNAFPPGALPPNRDGVPFDPKAINERDGFSNLTPLVAFFEDLAPTGLIGHEDLGAYLDADATTVIVNVETGERVPHFAELDLHAPEDQRTLILHPVAPMARGTRHVVGIRGLVRNDGSPVAPSVAFAGLRDGDRSAHPDLPAMVDRYEEVVFPTLEAAGLARDDLQLAWDFTTASAESVRDDVLTIRDDALSRLPADGPTYQILGVELGDCAAGDRIHKSIEGTVDVPRYTVDDLPGSVFARGADGRPTYVATSPANFVIQIPCSLAENPTTTPLILQYGHGLFGSRGEVREGWLEAFADDHRFVVFAMDWTGFAQQDAATITLMIASDISGFRMIPERTQQGFVEFAVGLRMMQTSIVDDPELSYGDVAVLQGAPLGYYGNSLGGILGSAYLGMSPDLERGVLGVVTGPFSLVLARSSSFTPFFLLLEEKYPDYRDINVLFGAMQTMWDAAEPAGYIDALTVDPLPGTKVKQVLMQVGTGDSQNTTLGAHVLARATGATTVAPQSRPIWGVTEAEPPFTGSALVEYLYTDVPPEPVENLPPDPGFNTHNCPRREPTGQAQIAEFLTTGVVDHFCDGPCESLRSEVCPG